RCLPSSTDYWATRRKTREFSSGAIRPLPIRFRLSSIRRRTAMSKAEAQLIESRPTTATRPDLCRLSATELARRIARGEVTALEAVEAHIARIERVNQKLNAVVMKRYDAARAEARDIDARRTRGEPLPPLAGVPITVKECIDLAGTPSTFGLPSRA